jgi:diguanylate cyclase (GGDEF)-like protein/PAS domain S-box-containing protein
MGIVRLKKRRALSIFLIGRARAEFRGEVESIFMSSTRSVTAQPWRILLALGIVAAVHLIRVFLVRQFGFLLPPYLTYIPPIIAIALLLGLWPGLAATMASALLVDFTIIQPQGTLQAKRPTDLITLAIAVLVCIGFCFMAEHLRKKRSRVTELESEHALHEARAKLQAALESSAEAMFICDAEGNIIDCNHAFAELHKMRDKSECMIRNSDFANFMDVCFLDGTLAPMDQWAVPRALRGEHATGVEYLERRKDTGETWIASFNFAPIRDGNGKIVGCVVSALDITERKRSEEALRNNENLYRSAFQTSLGAMGISRLADNKFIDVNRRFTDFYGYSQSEAVGKTAAELGLWANYADRERLVDSLREGGECRDVQVEFRRRDGSALWGVVCATRLEINGEECLLVSVRDVTKEKQAEEALRASEARYRSAFHTSTDAMVITRLSDRKYVDINKRFAEYFGISCDEAIGKTSVELGMWTNLEERERLFTAIARGEEYRDVPIKFQRRDGSPLWGMVSGVPFTLAGEPCILTSIHDVTKEKMVEEALRDSEARYRAAFETSPDVIVISRISDGVYIDVNPAFSSVTGWQREEVIGKTSRDLDIWTDFDHRAEMMEIIAKGEKFRDIEIQFRRKNGTALWGIVFATAMEVGGEPCLLVQVRDITNEKRAEEEIRALAFYDQVTGLANRRLLFEQFRKSIALSSRTHRKRAMLYVDLDNFKSINETRGHQTGDLLLHEVADRLVACVNSADTVSRLGGDEFVLILEELHGYPEIAATQAMEVAEKILRSMTDPFLLDQAEVRISCSIGITVFGDNQADFNHVLQQADIAMYQAKASGRNALRFFAPGLQAAVTARATLEEEMRQGLENNEFVLYFQPQYKHTTLYGAEALLRWRHPKRGIISPGEFISMAEETRLILPLGSWVLENACRQIARWTERYRDFNITVSVNVSALQLRRDDFVAFVLETVSRTGANPRWLKLELTESVLVENAEDTISKMTELKEHGIRFALDDFGTGYSSLAYLKRLPFSMLKIDASFVRDILTDPSSRAIVQSIVALSRAQNLRVLAEGVETEEQRAALEAMGCFYFQGYLFGPPLPPEEFEHLLLYHTGNPTLLPA